MKTNNEIIFKPIIINGIKTNYDISNRGGILINRVSKHVFRPSFDKDGYLITSIKVGINRITCSIHRLVAMTFIPNPENKPEINHIDGNKTNNDVSNLEWVTRKENADHAIKIGLYNPRGETNGSSIYTEKQIREACELMENPKNNPRYVSMITGISRATLYQIRKGNEWVHVSKDYDLPKINYKFGTNNVNNRYTDEQIHEVCRLLELGKYPKDIENETGVSSDTVQKIKKKEVWSYISDFYDFPDVDITYGEHHPNAKYTSTQIHEVCKLLEDPSMSYPKIEQKTGVKVDTICRIVKKGAWSSISKDYNLQNRIK